MNGVERTQERMGELLELGFREGGESAANPLAAMYMSLMVAPVRRLYAWAVPEVRGMICCC